MPAVTRSLISDDSSSAMAPMMVNIAGPTGLSVSTWSWTLTKRTPEINAAQVVGANGCALWAIVGQQTQQLRNAEVFSVTGDQRFQAIPPCPVASGARHG